MTEAEVAKELQDYLDLSGAVLPRDRNLAQRIARELAPKVIEMLRQRRRK